MFVVLLYSRSTYWQNSLSCWWCSDHWFWAKNLIITYFRPGQLSIICYHSNPGSGHNLNFENTDTTFFFFILVILKDSAACEIKSRAVVKYSAAPPPATYALLQEKTDLKLPPANWLRESPQLGSAGTTILGSSSKSKPFSRYNIVKLFWFKV